MRLILHAPNVHTGGGAVLAQALLDEIQKHSMECVAIFDARFRGSLPPKVISRVVQPDLLSRLQAERDLSDLSREGDLIVCFGNLPPLFKQKVPVILYLQNRNLLPGIDLRSYPWKVRWRLRLERLWLRLFAANANHFAVQTTQMQEVLLQTIPEAKCSLIPFVPRNLLEQKKPPVASEVKYDFLYVSSGDAHKNHGTLLDAWEILAEKGETPSLALTLNSTSKDLLARIERLQKNPRIRITNLPNLSYAKTLELYAQCEVFIFPSLQESFGIPLLEAAAFGKPIIASNLPYVFDVVMPAITFDPLSARAIAECVEGILQKRKLKIPLEVSHFDFETFSPHRALVAFEKFFHEWRPKNDTEV